ncbi:Ig-like domain-containing protein [Streptomyces sp. NPDC050738]|uniref:L,D-transpeptidase n=1 Tax=Streptomyces sp. NPDC050738 TaxID=3154744 RepID=UPI0034316968
MGTSETSGPSGKAASDRNWTRRGVLAALGVVPLASLAGCAGTAGASGTAGGGSASSTSGSATVTVTPADGSGKADFGTPVTVAVAGGTLTSVKVADASGSSLAGKLDAARTLWTSTDHPYSGTAYTVTAQLDGSGQGSTHTTSFTTRSPAATFVGYFTPEAGSTSGVGMPVSINFTHAVTDRAAVEKAITVTADPPVEVVGHWFGDTRLDFRPEEYWAANTKVTLSLRLKDIEGADGVYGKQSKDVVFHIGREQVSTVDLSSKKMTVRRGGKAVATYPVSGGDSAHPTWSGKMVISERFTQTKMDSSTVGLGDEYSIADVPHAQRLTTSGTFVHGNYWASTSVFGSSNTSHGCVGMHDAKGARDKSTAGAEFYNSSMLGDVVEVVNSAEDTVDPSNGLNGWNLSWEKWKAGSAL